MAITSEDLRRQALALPDVERADLAAQLLISLEGPTADDPVQVRAEWATEIERRAQRVLTGEVNSQDWTAVRQQLAESLGE
jgi:Putative addiction module component